MGKGKHRTILTDLLKLTAKNISTVKLSGKGGEAEGEKGTFHSNLKYCYSVTKQCFIQSDEKFYGADT